MYFTPTKEGGRRISGATGYGDFAITLERDHDGPLFDYEGNQVGHATLAMKTPPEAQLTDEQQRQQDERVAARAKACADCPAHSDLTDTHVTCRNHRPCSSRLSLTSIHTTCPDGRWPGQSSND